MPGGASAQRTRGREIFFTKTTSNSGVVLTSVSVLVHVRRVACVLTCRSLAALCQRGTPRVGSSGRSFAADAQAQVHVEAAEREMMIVQSSSEARLVAQR